MGNGLPKQDTNVVIVGGGIGGEPLIRLAECCPRLTKLNLCRCGDSLATAAAPLACHAAAPAWVEPVSNVLDPCFFIIQFIMLLRVIISWFPETDVNEMPWVLVCAPTEGLLKITRDIVPPSFGVDISPVVWIAVASFLREILLGQQGILVLMAQGRM